jgi:uncharacterized membrane protein (UPF0127 family)
LRSSARRLLVAALFVATACSSSSSTGRLPFTRTNGARSPFAQFDEARVSVGARCVRVLVASTLAQRVQGLRDVRSLAPYDGMIFVFPSDTTARFTMANTPMPLDIGWYASDGAPVDRTQMTPCAGTDRTCPAYASKKKYRYALETPAGGLGAGAIGACAA